MTRPRGARRAQRGRALAVAVVSAALASGPAAARFAPAGSSPGVADAGTLRAGRHVIVHAPRRLSALAERVAEAGGNPASDADLMATAQLEYSLAGRMGRAMEPVIGLMGFDWKIGTGLIGAFAAKEVFVAQMGTVYSIAGADENSATLRDRLRRAYSPLVAFCIMLYALISTPCLSTVAVMRRESNSWRWPLIQFWGLTAIAYVLTVVVYQVGIRVGPLLGGIL